MVRKLGNELGVRISRDGATHQRSFIRVSHLIGMAQAVSVGVVSMGDAAGLNASSLHSTLTSRPVRLVVSPGAGCPTFEILSSDAPQVSLFKGTSWADASVMLSAVDEPWSTFMNLNPGWGLLAASVIPHPWGAVVPPDTS